MSSIFSLKQWGLETRNLALKTCGEEKPENVKDPEKRMHTSLCALIISLHLGVYIYISMLGCTIKFILSKNSRKQKYVVGATS
jgi:hypothetical protein